MGPSVVRRVNPRWRPPRPSGTHVSRSLIHLGRASAALGLVVHFSLTVGYLMPANPMTSAWQPFLDATVGVFFEQDWGMFAPNPASSDFALLAHPLTAVEVVALPATGLPPGGWYDLSTPLWAGFQQNRFSAYE